MPGDTSHILTLKELKSQRDFKFEPDAEIRSVIARELGFDAIKKLRFVGHLRPDGSDDWLLEADLGATIVQPCSVTLAPVTTRIDSKVTRTYRSDFEDHDTTGEFEIPENDNEEPLPATLDLFLVMAEALSLAAPDYPRADGVDLETSTFSEPGVAPMTDEDTKPFAALKALKSKLGDQDPG